MTGPVEVPGPSDVAGPDEAAPALARQQRAVVAAVTGTGAPPAGFAAERVEAARRALLVKRARTLRHVWPLLADSLGSDLVPLFAAYAARRPTRGVRADGHDFASWLAQQGRLPREAAIELARARVSWVFDPQMPPLPRTDRSAIERFPGGRVVRVGRRVRVVGG